MLNFTMKELLYSDIAQKHAIKNLPDSVVVLDNLLNLITCCLQPLRDKIKKPIIITSGYRNASVNKLVGGAKNSQHTLGQAADITVAGTTPKALVEIIQGLKIEYDQLINEYDKWVHISYAVNQNRKMYFKINS